MSAASKPELAPASSFWQSLLALLLSDPTRLFAFLSAAAEYIRAQLQKEGLYEVLEHECQLELYSANGKDAIYSKRQRVRFLQNNVIAYQDEAWGDGDIFAEYQCSPGIPVDRYKEGYRYHILISLRKTMNRGDEEEFHIRRRIRDGFTKVSEDFQAKINHRTHRLTMRVIFPPNRLPKHCWIIEQNARKTHVLAQEHFRQLADQRLYVTWQTVYPRRFEAYILMWEW